MCASWLLIEIEAIGIMSKKITHLDSQPSLATRLTHLHQRTTLVKKYSNHELETLTFQINGWMEPNGTTRNFGFCNCRL
jgi:hypothetical protein